MLERSIHQSSLFPFWLSSHQKKTKKEKKKKTKKKNKTKPQPWMPGNSTVVHSQAHMLHTGQDVRSHENPAASQGTWIYGTSRISSSERFHTTFVFWGRAQNDSAGTRVCDLVPEQAGAAARVFMRNSPPPYYCKLLCYCNQCWLVPYEDH